VVGFEDQIPGGNKPRPISPGEKGREAAGYLRPFLDMLGLRFNEDALASVITSIVVFVRSRFFHRPPTIS
jgi:hypothetical protein